MNNSTLFKGISFSYLYIIVYLFTGLLTTPLLLNHFEAEYFSLLMIVYAIVTYLNNIKFGLPESLAVMLARNKNRKLGKYLIRKVFFILVIIVLLTLSIFFISDFFIEDWRVLLGAVNKLNKENVLNVFYILILFALVRIPLDISLSVFIGSNDVFLEKLYKIINLVINFTLVLFVINSNSSIVFFVFWAGLLDFIVSIIGFIHMMIRYKLLGATKLRNKIKPMQLLQGGVLFFQLSMTQTIIWGSGIFLVSHILTLEDVAIYSLNIKIYTYILYAFIIINTLIAPMYGKFYSQNNWQKIEIIFNVMILVLPFFGGVIWISTIYFMSDIMFLWTTSKDFYAGMGFVFFMGMLFYFIAYVNTYITLLYSIGAVKNILYVRWKEVVLNISLSFILVYLFGFTGIAIGMTIAIYMTSVRSLPKYIQEKSKGNLYVNLDLQKKHFLLVLIPNILIGLVGVYMIDTFYIKFILFIIMIALYIVMSFKMLTHQGKESLKNIIQLRQQNHEKK